MLPIAVCGVAGKVAGKIDNGDGLKGALLHADATTDAKLFRNKGDLSE